MSPSSNATKDPKADKAYEKRLAARLRQRKCRARKRLHLLKQKLLLENRTISMRQHTAEGKFQYLETIPSVSTSPMIQEHQVDQPTVLNSSIQKNHYHGQYCSKEHYHHYPTPLPSQRYDETVQSPGISTISRSNSQMSPPSLLLSQATNKQEVLNEQEIANTMLSLREGLSSPGKESVVPPQEIYLPQNAMYPGYECTKDVVPMKQVDQRHHAYLNEPIPVHTSDLKARELLAMRAYNHLGILSHLRIPSSYSEYSSLHHGVTNPRMNHYEDDIMYDALIHQLTCQLATIRQSQLSQGFCFKPILY